MNVRLFSSILDYPHAGLDSTVWSDDGKLLPEHKEFILSALEKNLTESGFKDPSEWIEATNLVGSLTTYQYLPKTDVDIHMVVDLDKFKKTEGHDVSDKEAFDILDATRKSWSKKEIPMLPGTKHPLEFFFQTPLTHQDDSRIGVYNINTDEWTKEPFTVSSDFDIEELKPKFVEMANEMAAELDLALGEIRRDVIRIEELQAVVGDWSKDKKKAFEEKINKKIEEVEAEIESVVKVREDLVEERHHLSNVESETEVKFKYLQKFGYLYILTQLKDLLKEDGGVTEDNIDEVKDIVENCEQKTASKDTKKLMIDFDDTIAENSPDNKIEDPMPGAKEALDALKAEGWTIVIYSVRANSKKGADDIRAYMKEHDLPFDELFIGKPHAEYYIDDRNIVFTSWKDVMNTIDNKDSTKEASFKKIASAARGWLDPKGKFWEFGDFDYSDWQGVTHDDWAMDSKQLLHDQYNIDLYEDENPTSQLIEHGWTRISDDHHKLGVHLLDIKNIPDFVESHLLSTMGPDTPITVEDADGIWVEITDWHTGLQKAVNRELQRKRMIQRQVPVAASLGKTAQHGVKYDYSSTQFNLPKDVTQKILEWSVENIPNEDLYDDETNRYGRELESHVTVLYGLTTNDASEVEKLLEDEKPVRVKFLKTRHFNTETGDNINIEVESEDLVKLNKKLSELDHESLHDEYHPHVSIAYVKDGKGHGYSNKEVLDDVEIELSTLKFSPKEGDPVFIELGKKKDKEAAFMPSITQAPDNPWQDDSDVEIPVDPDAADAEENWPNGEHADKPRNRSWIKQLLDWFGKDKTPQAKTAASDEEYWINPQGQLYEVEGSHERWILENLGTSDLPASNFDTQLPEDGGEENYKELDAIHGEMLQQGWVRIGSANMGEKGNIQFSVELQNMRRIPSFVEDFVAAHSDDSGIPIAVADNTNDMLVEVIPPFTSLQKAVNHELLRTRRKVAAVPTAQQIDENTRVAPRSDGAGVIVYVDDLELVPDSLNTWLAKNVNHGDFVTVQDKHGNGITLRYPMKDIRRLIRYKLYAPTASLKLASSGRYWIDPNGKVYSVPGTHTAWVCRNAEKLNKKFGYDLPIGVREGHAYTNMLIDKGWVRIGNSNFGTEQFLVDVADLNNIPSTVDQYIAENFNPNLKRPILVGSGIGKTVSIDDPFPTLQDAVNNELKFSKHSSLDIQAQSEDEILNLIKSTGGATWNLSQGNLSGTKNYAISIYPERSMILDHEPTAEEIKKYIEANNDLLGQAENSFGAWFDNGSGKYYLDVVVTIPDRDQAIELGKAHNQKAIFDLEKFEEIPTGGTGEVQASYDTTASISGSAWVDPKGHVYEFPVDLTHSGWIRQNTPLLTSKYHLKINIRPTDSTYADKMIFTMLENGWVRVNGYQGSYEATEFSIQVDDLMNPPDSLQMFLDQYYDWEKGDPVLMDDMNGNYAEVDITGDVRDDIRKGLRHDKVPQEVEGKEQHNTTWDEPRQDMEPFKPLPTTFEQTTNDENLNSRYPWRFMRRPNGPDYSDENEVNHMLMEMPISKRQAELHKEAMSDFAAWIDPAGKIYTVRDSGHGGTHLGWIENNMDALRKEYHYEMPHNMSSRLYMELYERLIQDGWVRVGDSLSRNMSISIQLKDLRNIPSYVDDYLATFYQDGMKVEVEQGGTYTNQGQAVALDNPFPTLQKAVNRALVSKLPLAASRHTKAYTAIGFWVAPDGKAYDVRGGSHGLNTHAYWVTKNAPLLAKYGIADAKKRDYFEVAAEMLNKGWARIGDTSRARGMVGVEVANIKNLPSYIDDTLASFMEDGQPIIIADLNDNWAEVQWPFRSLQQEVRRTFNRRSNLIAAGKPKPASPSQVDGHIDQNGSFYTNEGLTHNQWCYKYFKKTSGKMVNEGWMRIAAGGGGGFAAEYNNQPTDSQWQTVEDILFAGPGDGVTIDYWSNADSVSGSLTIFKPVTMDDLDKAGVSLKEYSSSLKPWKTIGAKDIHLIKTAYSDLEVRNEAYALWQQAVEAWESQINPIEQFIMQEGGIAPYKPSADTRQTEEREEYRGVPVRLRGIVPYDEMLDRLKIEHLLPDDTGYGDLYEVLNSLPTRGRRPKLQDFVEEAKHNLEYYENEGIAASKIASTYTDQDMEKITDEQHKEDLPDDTGPGNSYHDFPDSTTDYPKPRDTGHSKIFLDRLDNTDVPLPSYEVSWFIGTPRGDDTN